MRKIKIKQSFKEDLQRLFDAGIYSHDDIRDSVDYFLECLEDGGELPPYFGAHRLFYRWAGYWDAHMDGYPGNLLAIYKQTDNLATLHYAGGHKYLFMSDWNWKTIQRRKSGRGIL